MKSTTLFLAPLLLSTSLNAFAECKLTISRPAHQQQQQPHQQGSQWIPVLIPESTVHFKGVTLDQCLDFYLQQISDLEVRPETSQFRNLELTYNYRGVILNANRMLQPRQQQQQQQCPQEQQKTQDQQKHQSSVNFHLESQNSGEHFS